MICHLCSRVYGVRRVSAAIQERYCKRFLLVLEQTHELKSVVYCYAPPLDQQHLTRTAYSPHMHIRHPAMEITIS